MQFKITFSLIIWFDLIYKKRGQAEVIEKEEDEEEGNDENIDSRNLVTIKGLEMPEGVDFNELENEDDNSLNDQDPHKALSKFTLDEPLVFEKKKKSKSKKLKSEKGVKSKAKEDRVKSNITIS